MEEQNVITKNKGGRPKKAIKKDQLMAIKCTLYERKVIEARAKSANLSVSEYLREIGLTGKIDRWDKALPKEVLNLTAALNHMGANLNQIAKKRNGTDVELQLIVQKGFTDVKLMIGTQPKSIIRKFQILLFPEQDAKLFYKVVFSRWFLWLVIMLFLTNLYKWGIHYSDNQKEIELEHIENERIRKSWNYMYNNNGKDVKRMMEKAYINSEHAEDQ